MTAARYWRIRVKTVQNPSVTVATIPEMEFRQTPGGADECVAGQSQASSINSGSYIANFAVDNNSSTRWASVNGGGVNGQWIDNDIASGGINVKEIREVAIITTIAPQDINQMVRTGVIDYSEDRVTWVAHTAFTLDAWTTAAGQTKIITVGSSPDANIPNDMKLEGVNVEAWNTGPPDTPAKIEGVNVEAWNTGPPDTPAKIEGVNVEVWIADDFFVRRRRPVNC